MKTYLLEFKSGPVRKFDNLPSAITQWAIAKDARVVELNYEGKRRVVIPYSSDKGK